MLGWRRPDGETLPESFGITPLAGWRSWRVIQEDGPWLAGLRNWRWPARQVHAQCLASGSISHDAPHPDCGCGVYANLDGDGPTTWWSYIWGYPIVHGYVDMWGRIIRCERGYRAEHVRIRGPLTLQLTCRQRTDYTDLTGRSWCRQPVVALHRDWLIAWCDQHMPDIPEDQVVAAGDWLRRSVPTLEQRYSVTIEIGEP